MLFPFPTKVDGAAQENANEFAVFVEGVATTFCGSVGAPLVLTLMQR